MVSRAELIEIFGHDGVVTASPNVEDSLEAGAVSLASLVTVGLPEQVGGIFSARLATEPEIFSIFPVIGGKGPLNLIVLGAPNHDSSMRYLLDSEDGYVVLIDLKSEDPQLETINESLEKFIEFLYRVARFRSFKRSVGSDRVAVADYKEMLSAYLMKLDSFAMAKPSNWWSMVFDRVL